MLFKGEREHESDLDTKHRILMIFYLLPLRHEVFKAIHIPRPLAFDFFLFGSCKFECIHDRLVHDSRQETMRHNGPHAPFIPQAEEDTIGTCSEGQA